jgi:hypothetical protein
MRPISKPRITISHVLIRNHLPILPYALFNRPSGSSELSKPMLLVLPIRAFVDAPVEPGEDPLPVHLVVSPLPNILTSICPCILPRSSNLIILKLTCIGVAVHPEIPESLLIVLIEFALVLGTIRPDLLPVAMLAIVKPVPAVDKASRVHEAALAIRLAVDPAPFVHITRYADKPAVTVRLAVAPLPFINTAI